MRIGGFQKVSLIDYPGKIAAIVFTQGCNFRCGYCHNPGLVVPQVYGPLIEEEVILQFLISRQNRLQGVVVSGGEPTIQKDLDIFLKKLKDLNYLVKLDTNGSHPAILKRVIAEKLVDYVAMDVKAPLKRYEEIIGVPIDPGCIKESIEILQLTGIPHHFRTTVIKEVNDEESLSQMKSLTMPSKHILQIFQDKHQTVGRVMQTAAVHV